MADVFAGAFWIVIITVAIVAFVGVSEDGGMGDGK